MNAAADPSGPTQMARVSQPTLREPQQAKQKLKTPKPEKRLAVQSAHLDKRPPITAKRKHEKPRNDAQDAKKSCVSVKPANNELVKRKRNVDVRRREPAALLGRNVVPERNKLHAKLKPQLKPKLPSAGNAAACAKRKWPQRPNDAAHALKSPLQKRTTTKSMSNPVAAPAQPRTPKPVDDDPEPPPNKNDLERHSCLAA